MVKASRERFLRQLARCVKGQNNAHTITIPDDVPRSTAEVWEQSEYVPIEAMGNGEPTVPCEVESHAAIGWMPTEPTGPPIYTDWA